MLEPPDSANRPPTAHGDQGPPAPRPQATGPGVTVAQAGGAAIETEGRDGVAAGAVGATGREALDRDAIGAVTPADGRDGPAHGDGHGEATRQVGEVAPREVERSTAARPAADDGAASVEVKGAGSAAGAGAMSVEGARPVEGKGAGSAADDDAGLAAGGARSVEGDRIGPAGGQPASGWSHDWLQLSHELRTPLNAILGNIELLLDGSAGPLAAPARACIGDIQLASRQLLDHLQPLLLLVKARTSGALATRMPLDLLALIRQASADAACPTERDPALRPKVPYPGIAGRPETLPGPAANLTESPAPARSASLAGPASLMVSGDPIWLGALAAALVDLHASAPGARGPLSIDLEPPEPGTGGVVLRASWKGLDPATTGPVPLALIDAVLALHGGRIRGFCSDGLRLDLPLAVAGTGRPDLGPG